MLFNFCLSDKYYFCFDGSVNRKIIVSIFLTNFEYSTTEVYEYVYFYRKPRFSADVTLLMKHEIVVANETV